MFASLLTKIVLQLGSQLLLGIVKAGVTTLQARTDNTLGLSADTIHLILKDVNIVAAPDAPQA